MIIEHQKLFDYLPHPLPLSVQPKQAAFFDLETKAFGRKNSPIRYLGLIFFQTDGWYVHQWIPETSAEETSMLQELLSLLPRFSWLIHYNGISFDLPVLSRRLTACGLSFDLSTLQSLDLYRSFSPLKKLLSLPQLDQKTLESFLGLSRTSICDNDLTMLPRLLPLFSCLQVREGCFQITDTSIKGENTDHPTLSVHAILSEPVPVPFSLHFENGYLACEKKSLRFLFYGIRDTLKYFYPDYKNYYYLPEEDMAIHKSVASYVDREHRMPAKASNCYTKKYGCFLSQGTAGLHPSFSHSYRDKNQFLLLDQKLLTNNELLFRFLIHTLKNF